VIAGGLPDKIGPRHVAAVAAVLEAAGLALIALGGGLASDVAGAVIMGTAYSVLYPSLSLIVIERVPPSRRGAALGTFTGAFDFGVGIGAPLVGAVSALTDYSGGFLFAAILALLPAFAYLFAIARHRPGVA
jgi:MFS family permease